MRESPLKVAVLGLNDTGRLMLEAAKAFEQFTITAVGDNDTNLAQQLGKEYDCAAYDDYRQLIIQNQLDCLFVAAPLHSCAEYLKMAIKKKSHILKAPPMSRNFTGASEFVKLAQNEGVTFAVANTGRFAQSFLAARGFVLQNSYEQPFLILAAAAQTPPDISQAKWRNDPVLAGGGVILYDCWEIIDQIVWNFGLPQQVYCAAGSTTGDRQQRLYLTENSAIITMKFSDTLCGNLLAGQAAIASSNTGKPQKWLIAQGQQTLIKCGDKAFEVTYSQGQKSKKETFKDDTIAKMKNVLENFGSHLLRPEQNQLVCSAADNLKNMAFIEAAYLSARTGMPEEPARILKIT
jgi:predicted dehydrogenase